MWLLSDMMGDDSVEVVGWRFRSFHASHMALKEF